MFTFMNLNNMNKNDDREVERIEEEMRRISMDNGDEMKHIINNLERKFPFMDEGMNAVCSAIESTGTVSGLISNIIDVVWPNGTTHEDKLLELLHSAKEEAKRRNI